MVKESERFWRTYMRLDLSLLQRFLPSIPYQLCTCRKCGSILLALYRSCRLPIFFLFSLFDQFTQFTMFPWVSLGLSFSPEQAQLFGHWSVCLKPQLQQGKKNKNLQELVPFSFLPQQLSVITYMYVTSVPQKARSWQYVWNIWVGLGLYFYSSASSLLVPVVTATLQTPPFHQHGAFFPQGIP